MTATRDRHSDLDNPDDEPAWDERPIVGASRGLPWWGAVVVALGLTTIAAIVDMQSSDNTLGRLYQIGYVVSCVVAIAWVRRRSVFTAMVQPPLVFAATFVGAYLFLADRPAGDGMKQFALSVGLPLANNFPTMAIGTAIALLIGGVRLFTQRNPNKGDADRDGADDLAGPPPPLREVRGRRAPRDEVAPPPGRGRFSRGGRPDDASAERAARADRAERAGNPDRRRQGNRAEGVDRPGRAARGDRGERGATPPPERRRGERGRPRTEPDAERGDRRGRAGRDPRAAGGRPQRDDRGRGAEPRRGGSDGGRPQPPRRRPRDER
ncbi:DUF6542 domain-containing protein [Labedaea rhizosphaerae]|uniref:DUF6542 domain-containing protein n=1 Tax=Labedaea rhizosphaerae TaxID=598644 RepID=A0A4R6SKU4_LABRH|nr:DUF6542 domain-containing protein [Labedaea rhizosphaerae]TDQ04180.1 hypothetical protein EV186_101122 [Labedaea rhizosphaerae]